MQKSIRIFFLFVILFLLSFLSVPHQTSNANMGPPSNVRIFIDHFDIDYQLDVLIYQQTPLSQAQIDLAHDFVNCGDDPHFLFTACYHDVYYTNTYPAPLITFRDQDGFVSNTLYGSVSFFYGNLDAHSYVLYLHVPRTFKLVLVNEAGEKIISEEIIMKTYDYSIRWDLSDTTFTSEIQYEAGVISGLMAHPLLRSSTYIYLTLRLIVTLIIELSLLLVFGFIKKRTFVVVTLVNVITQLILSGFVLSSFYAQRGAIFGPLLIFFFGELIIFIIEMLTHAYLIKEHTRIRRIAYAFVANLVSMIVGLIVMLYLLTTLFIF